MSFGNDPFRNYDACVVWEGAKTQNGYGQRWNPRRKKVELIHRMAWEEVNGPIPTGMLVLHRCDVRACYQVSHLFLGTAADNSADMVAKERSTKLREVCKKGHLIAEVGAYLQKNGRRTCKACAKERIIRYHERQNSERSIS